MPPVSVSLVCLVFCLALTVGTPSPPSCTHVRQLFMLKNITVPVPDTPTNGSGVCRGEASCCSREMEATLQQAVTKDLHALLHHNFQSIHGMLANTAATLKEQVESLTEESEKRTMGVFEEVYSKMWGGARGPVSGVFGALGAYLGKAGAGPAGEDGPALERTVLAFFTDLFPLVYHQAVHHLHQGDFSPEYRACLKEAVERVQPFGSYPRELASQVARSFEATKVVMEALSLGMEVLEATDGLVSGLPEEPDSCREALVRLYYCPRCLGLPPSVKPCNGYCLNVMRGCLTQQRTTELDLPWSNFLEETEGLVRQLRTGSTPFIQRVLEGFPSAVSEAIMHATMTGPELEKKVKKACGGPVVVDGGKATAPAATKGTPPQEPARPGHGPSLAAQLDSFLYASSKARGFYANLAEALCSDDSFAETRDTADCWNGQRVGEYTKALVRPGVDAQKYNPELKWREVPPDPRIRQMSDKLRHMREVVLSRMGEQSMNKLESDSLLKEGSGSGGGPGGWSPEDDEPDWTDQGSGSGVGRSMHPYNIDGMKPPHNAAKDIGGDGLSGKKHDSKKTSQGATAGVGRALSSASLLVLIIAPLAHRWHH